jgi:hypothetical protein
VRGFGYSFNNARVPAKEEDTKLAVAQ